MTACLATTRLHCPDYKSTGLRPEISAAAARWNPDNKATGLRPDNSAAALPYCSGRIANFMHECPLLPCYPATLLQWQDTKLHARMRTAALMQWQDTKLHARVVALLQWQFHKLHNCNNNNNSNSNIYIYYT
jgi:hypothetical protein